MCSATVEWAWPAWDEAQSEEENNGSAFCTNQRKLHSVFDIGGEEAGSMEESGKGSQKGRRRQRQREDIWGLLAGLPAPFGLHAASSYRDLGSFTKAGMDTACNVVQWQAIPPSCEPCAMLGNPANRGKKHGKSVLEQIGMLSYAPAAKDAAAQLTSKDGTHAAEPAQLAQLDKRGMQKRWQVGGAKCCGTRALRRSSSASFALTPAGGKLCDYIAAPG